MNKNRDVKWQTENKQTFRIKRILSLKKEGPMPVAHDTHVTGV